MESRLTLTGGRQTEAGLSIVDIDGPDLLDVTSRLEHTYLFQYAQRVREMGSKAVNSHVDSALYSSGARILARDIGLKFPEVETVVYYKRLAESVSVGALAVLGSADGEQLSDLRMSLGEPTLAIRTRTATSGLVTRLN